MTFLTEKDIQSKIEENGLQEKPEESQDVRSKWKSRIRLCR